MQNLGHKVSATTVADVLRRHGVEPAPERKRKTTWKEFLTKHWDQIVAADFFTIEVWTKAGLQRFMILFFIELSTKARSTWQHREVSKWSLDGTDRQNDHRLRKQE